MFGPDQIDELHHDIDRVVDRLRTRIRDGDFDSDGSNGRPPLAHIEMTIRTLLRVQSRLACPPGAGPREGVWRLLLDTWMDFQDEELKEIMRIGNLWEQMKRRRSLGNM